MTANTATEMSRTRFISRAVVLACAALLSVACQFRDLDYDYIDTAKFTLIFDWSQSSLKGSGIKTSAVTPGAVKPGDVINGRTAAFYPMNGGDPVIKMSHSDTISVNLLVGQYRAVFFNEHSRISITSSSPASARSRASRLSSRRMLHRARRLSTASPANPTSSPSRP